MVLSDQDQPTVLEIGQTAHYDDLLAKLGTQTDETECRICD